LPRFHAMIMGRLSQNSDITCKHAPHG